MTRKAVDILALDVETMEQVRIGRVILEDGIIRFEDMSEKFIRTLNEGIIGKAADGVLYPKDAERFLRALQIEFSGSMIRASEVRVE